MKKIFILILLTIHLLGNTIEFAKDLFDNKQQYKEAIDIFQKFPDDAEAQYYIGKANFYGMGVEKDLKKAFEYAKKSADKNNSSGLNLLGLIYANGNDEMKAFDYFKKSVDLENTKGMLNLSTYYIRRENFEEAKRWLNNAHDLGDLNATLELAFFLSSTEIKNYKEAIIYYDIYMKSGYKMTSNIYYRMASAYENIGDYEKAYEFYVKSVEFGDKDGILSIIYSEGIRNILSDEEYLDWLKKGVELKLELAYQPLYMYYQEKKDFKNLKLFLEKAYYENKNFEMGCNLSSYYLNLMNLRTEKPDYEKAFKIANQIVENNPKANNLGSCYRTLSYMYEKGDYLSKDLNKAIEIRKKSSDISYEFDKKEDLKHINEKEEELKYRLKLFEKLDIKDEKVFPIINNFTKKEQVIAALETKKYFFFSVNDKSIKMYDKNNLSLLKEFRPWISSGLEGNPLQIVFDENKNILYFSTLNSTNDMSKNDLIHGIDIQSGKIIKTLKNIIAFKNIYLSISDDGKFIVAINNNNLINIINTENNEIQHYNLGDPIILLAANIIKEKDDYVVNVVSTDKKLYKFSINLSRNILIEDFNFQTNFRSFNGTHAEKIFENKNNINIENAKINSKDNLELKINNKFKEFDFKNLIFNEQDKSITSDDKSTSSLSINQKYDGKVIEFVNMKTKNKKEYFLVGDTKLLNSYPIKDKYILLITSDITFMPILNDKGEIIANLQGFSAFPKDIDIKNNKLVYTGLDNIIHIFNLDILSKLKYVKNEFDKEVLEGFSKQFGDDKDTIIENFLNFGEEDLENLRNTYNLSFTPTQDQIKNFFQLFMHKKEIIYPQLSLYIQNENDWIIYTPEGLFTYGGNGKDLLKYHQNQGLYKEAKIIENDRLFEKFYRPDLIKKILAGEKVEIPMDVKSVILNIMPPELKILINKMINAKDIELTYQVCDAGNGIADAKLIINGQSINPPQSRGFSIEQIDNQNDKCKIYKSVHTLYPGKSTIEFKAYDKDMNIANVSDKLEVTADYKIIEKSKNMSIDDIKKLETENNNIVLEKSNLYFLSLAVAEYEDKNYNLKYTVNDVESVKEKFVKNSKNTFENIFTYKLQDNEVTKDNIDKIFDEISKKLKINDTFVLYIAGHGTIQDGKYQFIPYKIDEKISIDNIKQNLAKIANYTNKSLVMLDTCYSGAVIENISDNATTNRLSHDNNSINYIVASSSEQVALEGYNNHGVFTYSVLDAFDKNQTLKVNVLSEHVTELVPKITQEKFHFEQRPQVKLNQNFILSDDK
ncbi:Sel1/tetratricopeptide repeat domain-containing protein [Aliarcobacter cibarius]|uniref:beta-lactamase n=1 Tax=Aliarcobacter cibarius TaxID=255507 RepID=A0A7L5JLP0_9BACT|nr:caspase family protein [Aliarcobacter cibarius]QKJ26135.1 Sel1/tetratricopeptide repeat domain-containing protein [Aliarcobacter cibarius]